MTIPINTMTDARALLGGNTFMKDLMDKVDAEKASHAKAKAMRVLAEHIGTMTTLDASKLLAEAEHLASAEVTA